MNDLTFQFLPKGQDIEVGDPIVSSGLDGVYPTGYPVGTVSAVNTSTKGLFMEAFVDPYVRFGQIDEVTVVLESGE